MEVRWGSYRVVLLVKRWAIKFPRANSWQRFQEGLLANRQERKLARNGWPELCPVMLADPLGLILVMPKARPLTNEEWANLGPFGPIELFTRPTEIIPGEAKRSSVGILDDGRTVIINYVDHGWPWQGDRSAS
jgi:hypothetical protein